MKKERYDAGDNKQVKKAKQVSRVLKDRMKRGLLKMAEDKDIRYVLSTFLNDAGVFRPTFSQVPTQHAYNDGFRNGGLWWVTNLLLHDPAIISKLQTDDGSALRQGQSDDGHDDTDPPDDDGDDASG